MEAERKEVRKEDKIAKIKTKNDTGIVKYGHLEKKNKDKTMKR